jgi:RNA-splicing ligase RtcB
MNAFVSRNSDFPEFANIESFNTEVSKLCKKQGREPGRIFASLGTLCGGNHFIEIDVDENHNRWLLIHSGSRIFGAHTAEFHEIIALRETEEDSPIKYLQGIYANDYLDDMRFVQHYARINRALVAQTIAKDFFKFDIREIEFRDCMHNYIDFSCSMIRKGAISAKQAEAVVIPFSMSEGAILGRWKARPQWNNSAPHGSGRKRNRSDARSLSLDEYRKEMRGVWSSVICKDTLEESPNSSSKCNKDLIRCFEA